MKTTTTHMKTWKVEMYDTMDRLVQSVFVIAKGRKSAVKQAMLLRENTMQELTLKATDKF